MRSGVESCSTRTRKKHHVLRPLCLRPSGSRGWLAMVRYDGPHGFGTAIYQRRKPSLSESLHYPEHAHLARHARGRGLPLQVVARAFSTGLLFLILARDEPKFEKYYGRTHGRSFFRVLDTPERTSTPQNVFRQKSFFLIVFLFFVSLFRSPLRFGALRQTGRNHVGKDERGGFVGGDDCARGHLGTCR